MRKLPVFKNPIRIEKTKHSYHGYKVMKDGKGTEFLVQCVIPSGSDLVMPCKDKVRANRMIYIAVWNLKTGKPVNKKYVRPYFDWHSRQKLFETYEELEVDRFSRNVYLECGAGFHMSRDIESLIEFFDDLHSWHETLRKLKNLLETDN
jgi:hypothetical protein